MYCQPLSTTHSYRLIPRDLDKIRVAIAGLGQMGHYHTRALQILAEGGIEEYYKYGVKDALKKLEICGVYDPDEEKCKTVALGIPHFSSWGELLTSTQPHMAIIASPTSTHYSLIMEALNHGVHVFTEKPVVVKHSEIKEVSKLAQEQGCRIFAGHVERYNPASIKLREILSDKLSSVNVYRFKRSQPHDPRIQDDIITDKVIHDLDLAQYFFGAIKDFKLTQVKRVQGNIHEATITLKHVNGIIGELFVSWDVPTASKCREIRVSLRDGSSIMGDFFNKSLFLNDAPISCHVPMWVRSDNNQIKDEIVDFLAYCMSASSENEVFKPLLNVNEVEVSVKIIEMLLKQSKNFVEEENLGHTKAII